MQLFQRLIFLSVFLLAPGLCHAFNATGSYSSTEGAITLQQNADRVSGSYTNDNGELIGLMFDNIFEGFWIENSSERRCSTPKNGRYHWGRATFTFDDNGFRGIWGHCDDKPARSWNGTRSYSGREQGFTSPHPADNDPFAISTEGPSLEGIWGSSEGEIRFRQQGNRVAGRYANDNGEIVGSLHNDTLSGYWIEDMSAERCTTAKNGRYYWGRLELRFSGKIFSGKYGHCEGSLKSPWNGERR